MSNLRNIQFLRSLQVYDSLALAKAALEEQAKNLIDGSPIVARYKYVDPKTEAESVKTVIGIAHIGVSGTTGVTCFESANDVADRIAQLQAEMDTTQATVGTDADGKKVDQSTAKYLSGKTTVEAEIKALNDAIEALDYTGYTLGDSEVFATITENDGLIAATGKNISGIKLAGYEEAASVADIATGDTLGQALGKLQKTIHEMDKTASAEDGKVVTTVSEVDGVVSETKANVKDLQLGGYSKGNDTGAIASTDTINVALSKLENTVTANKIDNADGSINVATAATGTDISVNIKNGEGVIKLDSNGNGIYTDLDLVKLTENLPTNVRERYQLLDSNDTQIGANIDIYKDSALNNIYIGHVDDVLTNADGQGESPDTAVTNGSGDAALVYIMHLENDKYKLAAVNVESFLEENEFASGVTATNHVVHGVVDPTSEKDSQDTPAAFLTVDAGGFKISGIKDEIDRKINALDAYLSGNTTHVTVGVAEADGRITAVTVDESDIASDSDLTAEINRAKSAETAIDSVIGSVKTQGSESRSYTKSNVDYATGVTVLADVELLDAAVSELSGKTFTNVSSDNNSITVATAETDNGTINVDVQTVASQISGLTDEASITTGAAKVSGVVETDNVQTGIKNLYASLKSEIAARKAAISSRTITSLNSGITVSEKVNEDGFATTIALTLDATSNGTGGEKTGANNALTITNNGLLSNTWNCGTF